MCGVVDGGGDSAAEKSANRRDVFPDPGMPRLRFDRVASVGLILMV